MSKPKTKTGRDKAQDFIDAIFNATIEMSDQEYIEFLEQISVALDDAVMVKRMEIDDRKST